ncbi:MAG: PD40 domain-containing protein [Ardenticatenaceae bacterium]|nr:PD40 domain-containing protein [Ardenticatenaceae bacterium]
MKHTLHQMGILITMLFAWTLAVQAAPGDIERVSLASDGHEGNDNSWNVAFSTNGRFVAFESDADNLVNNDHNDSTDIFVHDRQTNQTERVSVTSDGNEGHGDSNWPAISADGRFVTYHSNAPDLVNNDTNGVRDIFLHDRSTGNTERITININNSSPNGNSFRPTFSGNGRYITFYSDASDLVADDDNSVKDIFVYDRETRIMERITRHYDGSIVDGDSMNPVMNENGRFVAYYSWATKLVTDDNNGLRDVFVYDRQAGSTERVSLASDGSEGNGTSLWPAINDNGRFVAFQSDATNLVDNDHNLSFDVFVHDRDSGETSRVSVSSSGSEGNAMSLDPSLSGDGRFVTFYSWANNLVNSDTNLVRDVFAHDQQTGETILVSTDHDAVQANDASETPVISRNGRFVAFESDATNLITPDDNSADDVFVKELRFPHATATCDINSPYVNVIIGTDKNDKLTGTDGDDVILGLGGNDRLEGLGGNDCLIGGPGHDQLYGDEGNDLLWGGEWENTAVYSQKDRDKLYGGAGNDQMYGGGDQDRLDGGHGDDLGYGGDDKDKLYGKDGNDELYGEGGNDTLKGDDGDDFVYGGSGNDHVEGNNGNDVLAGDDHNDKLYGGPGDDMLDGGAGDDDTLEGSKGIDNCINGARLRGCE